MIEFNFKKNLDDHVSAELIKLDFEEDIAKLKNKENDTFEKTKILLRVKRRIPSIKVRNVYYPSTLHIPNEVRRGFYNLRKAIEDGSDLRPFLGRKNAGKMKYRDTLLDDWGLIHFHLGEGVDNSGLIERSAYVAFAIVNNDAVFFLDILNHNKENGVEYIWTQDQLLDIADHYWPQLLEHKIKNRQGKKRTSEEYDQLRSLNGNYIIGLSKGRTYFSPGGGRMSNGESMRDVAFCMKLKGHIRYIEDYVRLYENTIRERLAIANESNLTLKAEFSICPIEGFEIKVYHAESQKMIEFD